MITESPVLKVSEKTTDEEILSGIKTLVEQELMLKKIERKTRLREYAYARFLFFKLSREFTSLGIIKIGEFVKRDSATVLHGVKTFDSYYDQKFFQFYKDSHLKISKILRSGISSSKELNKKLKTDLKDIKLMVPSRFFDSIDHLISTL